MSDVHKGQCFCGAVEIEASGNPEGMGYCHCTSCRSWSAAPVNAFTLWHMYRYVNIISAKMYHAYNETCRSMIEFIDRNHRCGFVRYVGYLSGGTSMFEGKRTQKCPNFLYECHFFI